MYGRLRRYHLVVLTWNLVKSDHVRTRITRDTDLLSSNGWHVSLRRFILHRNESLLLPPGRRNFKLRLADWHVDKFQISTTKWLLTNTEIPYREVSQIRYISVQRTYVQYCSTYNTYSEHMPSLQRPPRNICPHSRDHHGTYALTPETTAEHMPSLQRPPRKCTEFYVLRILP